MAEVLDCRLKWPNDLQDSEERKLGGILAELYTREGTAPEDWRVILGVGLNINQVDFPGLPQATSLRRMRGEIQSRARLLEELLPAIEAVDPRAPGILDRWRARSNTLGRHVRVGEHQGLAESLREDGALVVGGHPVLAGDVELLADPASSTAC
jgi:BirA family biotin operon repressor/biotin-[acetyl-CoA-carboxylase] ligase